LDAYYVILYKLLRLTYIDDILDEMWRYLAGKTNQF